MKLPAQVVISEVAYGGRGVGRLDGKVCFVPGTLPGETVAIEVLKDRGNFTEAKPTVILTPSPHRIRPACPLASHCPGCSYQHTDYGEEVRIKNKQLQSMLPLSPLLPPVAAPRPDGYRNKMALHAQADGKDRRLGYFMEDNTTILDVPACPLAVAPLNALLAERRADPSFLKTLRNDMTITFRWTEKDGAVWWRNRAAENDVWLVESSVIGPLAVPRNSFYQMNPAMADRLVVAVMDRLKANPPDTAVDLYCGVGIFALAAATLGIPRVLGVDVDGPGIRAAEFNARKLGLPGIQWKTATAHDGIPELEHPQRTTLIVDPPRSGLGRQMIRDLIKHRPARILYISCAPDTMARDAAWLGEGGYTILSSQLFDMFPRTAHFESLTEFHIP